jgi:hypothetical protein
LWSHSDSNNAGGTPPEVRFSGTTSTATASSGLQSTLINTTDVNSALLTFRHAATVEGGEVTLRVETRAASTTWSEVWSNVVTANIAPILVSVPITSNHLRQPGFQLRWIVANSRFANLTGWYIDDITLYKDFGNTAIVTGDVTLMNGEHDLIGLRVKAGDFTTFVNDANKYSLYLVPGTYSRLEAYDPYYESNVFNNVVVTANDTLIRDLEAYYMVPVRDFVAQAAKSGIDDRYFTQLNWEHAPNDGNALGFKHFNIYRQSNSMHFERIGYTRVDSFRDYDIDLINRYRYYVVAEYARGVSPASEQQFVDPTDYSVNESDSTILPQVFRLEPNFPNPFNPMTNITFSIPTSGNVSVRVYNIRGQLVRNLADEHMNEGRHVLQWHGDNDSGRSVGSGIYFIRVQSGENIAIQKGLLLK